MIVVFNVKLQNVFRAFCMDVEDLPNYEKFLKQAVKEFRIIAPHGVDLQLFNMKRAPIDFQILPILVKQHVTDPNFFIEICIDTPGVYVQQSENLENYLRNHNCESILSEEKRNQFLGEESLEFLLGHLQEFVYSTYSLSPTPNELAEACTATIELFPSLTSDTAQKIDILYDRSKRSGLLYEKLRYKQRKRQGKKEAKRQPQLNGAENAVENSVEDLIAFLDSCVLVQDKSEILKKMKESVDVRKLSYRTNRELFDKCFHLYRVDPDLVLTDFKYMFADSDHDALIKKWPSIEKKPFEMFQVNLDRSSNKYHRDPILHNMLTFVKLFPTHRYKFERAVDSLIVFSDDTEVDPQKLVNKKSNYPHIICVYSEIQKKSKFYVVVSKSLMNVPSEYSFLQIMDLYFKIHFVFYVPFEPSLVQFMGAFEKYIYGIESDTILSPSIKNKAKSIFLPPVQPNFSLDD